MVRAKALRSACEDDRAAGEVQEAARNTRADTGGAGAPGGYVYAGGGGRNDVVKNQNFLISRQALYSRNCQNNANSHICQNKRAPKSLFVHLLK